MSGSHSEEFAMQEPRNQTDMDRKYAEDMNSYFAKSLGTNMDKLRNFAKYVPRQALSIFLAKNALFQKILNVHGHIIECGVFLGGGLMTWANLSSIYEPYNHTRKVIGFDTFRGFVKIDDKDKSNFMPAYGTPGGLDTGAHEDITESMRLFDLNRPIGHITKIELIVGDGTNTIPKFIKNNKHSVVAMLYLDFDLYEPTKVAIETFLPRMPKGAILVFDELNQSAWPGETKAVLDSVGLRNLKIERFPFTPQLSFAILD